MLRSLVVVGVVLTGCRYERKKIYLPPTAEAANCSAEAISDYERCLTYQRGRRFCAEMQDRAFLMCPGAKEGGPDGGEAVTTYELPGIYR